MQKIVFDTNFPLLPFTLGVDVYSEIQRIVQGEYKIFFPDYCLEELKKIKDSSVPAALSLMSKKGVGVMTTGLVGDADPLILKMDKQDTVVCTSDKKLKQELLKKGFRVIFPRGKKKLELR